MNIAGKSLVVLEEESNKQKRDANPKECERASSKSNAHAYEKSGKRQH